MKAIRSQRAFNPFILLVVLTASLCVSIPAGAASTLTMGDAIDKAGRQRMLTQRMVKAYVMTGMDLTMDAHAELGAAAELFDSQLAQLTEFAATPEESAQLSKISKLWGVFRPAVEAPPSVDLAGKLNELAEHLLKESHQFVLMLEKRSGTVAGKLVNISGRQRMLSQRIAKTYLLETWGVDAPNLDDQYAQAVDEFSAALSTLQEANINTSEIDAGLTDVEKNWNIFGISNFSKKYNARVPWLVVRSMEKILGQMNTITGLYAKLG